MNISQWPLLAPKIDFQNDIFMYIQQITQYKFLGVLMIFSLVNAYV